MISENILRSLTSKEGDPAYTLLVTGYETGEDCNSEFIKIKMHQINKGINFVETGLTPISKELIIRGALDVDKENELFITKLIGTSHIKTSKEMITEMESINSHYIECVVTNLADTIEIKFNQNYNHIPNINITIDKKNKNLFSDYDCDFDSHIIDNKYTGVTITFNKLRKKSTYPEINILIIGDKIVNTG